MTANRIRGEVDLRLGGRKIILRPTFAALVKIEAATGKSMPTLVELAASAALPLADVRTIIEACAVKPVDDLDALVQREGVLSAVVPITTLLLQALRGEEEDDDAGEALAPIRAMVTRIGAIWGWLRGCWAGRPRIFGRRRRRRSAPRLTDT